MKKHLFDLLATFDVEFTLHVHVDDSFCISLLSTGELSFRTLRLLSDLVLSFGYTFKIDASTGYLRIKIFKS